MLSSNCKTRIAHIRKRDGFPQPLPEHLRQVAKLCSLAARPLGLENMGFLLGLLHDMGKATEAFRDYLLSFLEEDDALSSPHPHAPIGARFVYHRWFLGEPDLIRRVTAQILALCIYGHHAGLPDCLDEMGNSPFLEAMEKEESYDAEAIHWFCEYVYSEAQLDTLFQAARTEIEMFVFSQIQLQKRAKDFPAAIFEVGMLARLLLSILVDADRWDSACFEHAQKVTEEETAQPDWNKLLDTFETYRKRNLSGEEEINQIRATISERCFSCAAWSPGIYTLCVPTGGGKTYSSLRFALRHAAQHRKQRIFYIIPYNTILDQNAQDIREALSEYPSILEHHSNVVFQTEKEQEAYRLLTERWDSDIILTSLVQFLNSCFTASNTDARRMYRLTNAVLIFDEIQALPKKCKTLFEGAISFLSQRCGSTVILCTATQPKLALVPPPKKLIEEEEKLFQQMKRVQYIPQLKPERSNGQAAADLAGFLEEQSVLAIVNTKRVALDVYSETVERLQKAGKTVVLADVTYPEEKIRQSARQSGPEEILCVHLSTLLCPAHRKKLIQWIKLWLKEQARVLCVSTALIEAGINVSFPVVVRSLAGLASVVQAAGRANRNMEYGVGQVYLWEFQEENLDYLPDIRNGGVNTRNILATSHSAEMDSPAQIEAYFDAESNYTEEEKDYPVHPEKRDKRLTLYSFLSDNPVFKGRVHQQTVGRQILLQSFRTANQAFAVIPEETVSVLVPFGEGQKLIEQLNGSHTMKEEIFLLRKAQAYSVSLYRSMFQKLVEEHAIWQVGQTGALALEEGFYDDTKGVVLSMETLKMILF